MRVMSGEGGGRLTEFCGGREGRVVSRNARMKLLPG